MCCVAALDGEYLAKLEDVLATYEKPLDATEPVVCIVHHQMDGGGRRVVCHQLADHLSKLGRRTVRGWPGEVHPGFRCYGAENIGRAASLVLIVLAITPG